MHQSQRTQHLQGTDESILSQIHIQIDAKIHYEKIAPLHTFNSLGTKVT